MEQQRLKGVADKKEQDRIRKQEEAEQKRLEDNQCCGKEAATFLSPAQITEEDVMGIYASRLVINFLLFDLMQGNTVEKQSKDDNHENRSPPKDKHKNNIS
jgi:hypothetical protein